MRVLSFLLLFATTAAAQPARTIFAVGAHAGDVELTSGALLIRHHQLGDRIVILHMTLGERGHPGMEPVRYAEQKRREAEEAAGIIGAEVRFGPFEDGAVPDTEEARAYVATVIRDVRPTHIITHWSESLHRDHAVTHSVVSDAVLMASLAVDDLPGEPHRGIRGIYFAENWEDAESFQPYVYVDVSAAEGTWEEAITRYEFVRGGISSFRYLEYYKALHILRGAEARTERAVAFDISPYGKKRVLDALP